MISKTCQQTRAGQHREATVKISRLSGHCSKFGFGRSFIRQFDILLSFATKVKRNPKGRENTSPAFPGILVRACCSGGPIQSFELKFAKSIGKKDLQQ
jgi:hypothetical protein